jgi:hypothetical protein
MVTCCATVLSASAADAGVSHIQQYGVALDLPSANWAKMPDDPYVRGVSIGRGDMLAAFTVQRLPGYAELSVNECKKGVEKDYVVTITNMTAYGRIRGTGTRYVATSPRPGGGRVEIVLFYPAGDLSGYSIWTILGGPPTQECAAEFDAILHSLQRTDR